jgi:hypothetical protein
MVIAASLGMPRRLSIASLGPNPAFTAVEQLLDSACPQLKMFSKTLAMRKETTTRRLHWVIGNPRF